MPRLWVTTMLVVDPSPMVAAYLVVNPRLVLACAAVVPPVPPDPTTRVAESPAAVPVVFWLRVGKAVMLAAERAGAFLRVRREASPNGALARSSDEYKLSMVFDPGIPLLDGLPD